MNKANLINIQPLSVDMLFKWTYVGMLTTPSLNITLLQPRQRPCLHSVLALRAFLFSSTDPTSFIACERCMPDAITNFANASVYTAC